MPAEYPNYNSEHDVSLLRKQSNDQIILLISKTINLKFADTLYAIMHERCINDPSNKNLDDFNFVDLRRQSIIEILMLEADITAPDGDDVVVSEQQNEAYAAYLNGKR
jgi:hypothetical protein